MTLKCLICEMCKLETATDRRRRMPWPWVTWAEGHERRRLCCSSCQLWPTQTFQTGCWTISASKAHFGAIQIVSEHDQMGACWIPNHLTRNHMHHHRWGKLLFSTRCCLSPWRPSHCPHIVCLCVFCMCDWCYLSEERPSVCQAHCPPRSQCPQSRPPPLAPDPGTGDAFLFVLSVIWEKFPNNTKTFWFVIKIKVRYCKK